MEKQQQNVYRFLGDSGDSGDSGDNGQGCLKIKLLQSRMDK